MRFLVPLILGLALAGVGCAGLNETDKQVLDMAEQALAPPAEAAAPGAPVVPIDPVRVADAHDAIVHVLSVIGLPEKRLPYTHEKFVEVLKEAKENHATSPWLQLLYGAATLLLGGAAWEALVFKYPILSFVGRAFKSYVQKTDEAAPEPVVKEAIATNKMAKKLWDSIPEPKPPPSS